MELELKKRVGQTIMNKENVFLQEGLLCHMCIYNVIKN